MDPVAHTLFGATLAEIGLKTKSRYATATLIIGANLPDVDAVLTLFGTDTALLHRRGMTHGIVAMAVLPLLLAGGVWLWNRRRPDRGAQPFHLPAIVGLAYLSTWSHPLLDWMNTYGVRLLMPLDGRWFYGDTLFIMDPWFWLTTSAGVVMARATSRRSVAGWVVLTALASLLVVGYPAVPLLAKGFWVAGVATVVMLRRTRAVGSQTVARVGLALLVVYIGAMFGLGRSAERAFRSAEALSVQSNPAPANPLAHRIVVEYATYFEIVGEDGSVVRVEKPPRDAVIDAAMASPGVAGFMNWTRFPIWDKRPMEHGGWEVTFRDLRYVEPGGESPGIGLVRVELDTQLNPVL